MYIDAKGIENLQKAFRIWMIEYPKYEKTHRTCEYRDPLLVFLREELPVLLIKKLFGKRGDPNKWKAVIYYDIPDSSYVAKASVYTQYCSRVTWLAIYHKKLIVDYHKLPKTTPIYITYLLSYGGERLYLSVNQPVPSNKGQAILRQLENQAAIYRSILSVKKGTASKLREHISLNDNKAEPYEKGNIIAIEYTKDTLPDDEQLISDLKEMLGYYERLVEYYLENYNKDELFTTGAPDAATEEEQHDLAGHIGAWLNNLKKDRERAHEMTGKGKFTGLEFYKAMSSFKHALVSLVEGSEYNIRMEYQSNSHMRAIPVIKIINKKYEDGQYYIYPALEFFADYEGENFYISLAPHSTKPKETTAEEFSAHARKMRDLIRNAIPSGLPVIEDALNLRGNHSRNDEIEKFEVSNILAIRYTKDNVPDDRRIKEHIELMMELYDRLQSIHDRLQVFRISLPLTLAPELINTVLAAAQAKRFLIFAGPTGTGKTAFFRELIRALGDKGRILTLKDLDEPESSELACYNLLHVPVRPDWTDPSELMGYTDLKGQYRPGILLKFVKLASQHTDRKFIFLLDEMNIAVVEHYFAPILSLMETMKDGPSDPIHVPRGSGYEDVRITDNVLFVGTVNIDDTTNRLSPKVLDRAFVIEFGAGTFEEQEGHDHTDILVRAGWWYGEAGSSLNEGLGDETRREVLGLLDEINKIYKENHLPFAVGYRTRDEILRFIGAYLDLAGKGGEEDHFSTALDMAVVTKILPRLFGGEELREALNALKKLAVEKSLERTRAKIDEMLSRLEQRAYTSFWR